MAELIAVPRYGWLYRLVFDCGCIFLTGQLGRYWSCPRCGRPLAGYPSRETLRCG